MNKSFKFYMVTVNEHPEFLTGKRYRTFEDAKEEVVKIIGENNSEKNYTGLMEITGETANNLEFPVKEFYVHTMEPPTLPDYLGKEAVCSADEFTGLFVADGEGIFGRSLDGKEIEELNEIICDFLEKKTIKYELGVPVSSEKVQTEDN